MIERLSLVDNMSENPIDHYGTKNTFHNLIIQERHDPHPGQASARDQAVGEKKNLHAEDYNVLFPQTFCLVTDPVNESRITRRRPRFDIQVDPVNVLSDDRDPRCTVVQTPVRIRGGTENTHLAYGCTLFKVLPGVGGTPEDNQEKPDLL